MNDTTPAISAANLNKLTNEIKSQALATGVSHTLPTWADGVVPAVSDPVPLNEMERVLLAVAAIKGLAYTRETWQAGWVPARNAARLNNMELQAQENRAALDQVASVSPLGYLSNLDPGFFPPTNRDKYGVVVTDGPPPAGFVGVNLKYMSAITCRYGATNITDTEALDNNWVMRAAGTNALMENQYGGYLADPGIPAYQTRWCQHMKTRVDDRSGHGTWIDDANPKVQTISAGAVRPTNYPTDASYQTALLSFAAAVKTFCVANNLKCAYNAFIPFDDPATATATFWGSLGTHADYLTSEYWMTPGPPAPEGTVRTTPTTQWYHYWPGHRNLHVVCNNMNVGFLPLSQGLNGAGRIYSLATFLLDWNGLGANMWVPYTNIDTDLYGNTSDPWVAQYAIAVQLGTPSGAAVQTGDVWTRQFSNGTVSVNPVNGTASIT